jgi:hypothetical protein
MHATGRVLIFMVLAILQTHKLYSEQVVNINLDKQCRHKNDANEVSHQARLLRHTTV